MAAIYGYSREAVRVKVKKCEANSSPEWRKFSVDPQITSLEVLYSILAKAFDIKSDFSISYKALDPTGQETYLVVLSDWDLDAAFLRAHNLSIQTGSEPCLNLRVDIKAFSEVTDWEANSPATKEISPFQQSIGVGQKYVQTMQNKLPGLIMNQMEKTFSLVQRALNLTDDQLPAQPPRPPLSDSEFRNFLDSVGQILHPNELRKVIFAGGIDPSLRRVVWKHILNVYPNEMTGRERMDYMKKKAAEYYKLRDVWRAAVQRGPVIGELAYVTSMVRKDVLRTDRLHPFYAGSDDNQNIASLFNILTTYALNHPSVSYCQGMSDIASPLLVTMGDEAHAYICFCAIMTRLKVNFMLDGISMTQKFTHLAEALQFYDPDFYEYLKAQQADDLLFCYRWLLLEMKREFPFEDSLRMLEVLWSSLGYEPPSKELDLFEREFELPPLDIPPPKSPSIIMRTPRENHYTKVCALRRQSSSVSLLSNSPNQSSFSNIHKLDATKRLNQSLDENISRLPKARNIIKAHQSLDETKMQMLMEHVATFETKSDEEDALAPERGESEEKEDKEDIEVKENEEDTKIQFHPTNPFLDDTQNDLEVVINKIENNQSPCDVFVDKLLSNRSSGDSQHVSPKKESHLSSKLQRNSVKSPSKNIFSYNTGNIISKQLNSKKGGHFKDLKEKIAASKKGILASLEGQMDVTTNSSSQNSITPQQTIDDINRKTRGQKVVKNFNEFLNFASMNKSRISDKLVTNSKVHSTLYNVKDAKQVSKQHRPLIKLTKNSFDESDSSILDTAVVVHERQQQSQPPPPSSGKPLQLHLTTIVARTQQSLDGSSPDDSQDYYPMTTSITRELRLDLENLDRQVFGDAGIIERNKLLHDSEIEYEKLGKDSLDLLDVRDEEIISCPAAISDTIVVLRNREKKNNEPLKRISTCSANTDIFVWENPLHQMSGASSCNFNEMVESNDDEHAIRSFINGVQDINQTVNAMTPDEQQDLEYDGEIVIECDGNELRKSVTPLRLIQSKLCSSRERDDSDSDNTDSWKNTINLNPFLQSKSSMQDFVVHTFNQDELQSQLQPLPPPVEIAVNPQIGEEAAEANVVSFTKTSNNILPSPKELGGGNPFLIFLCLTLLLQHRNTIMKSGMDYNEMAMHFDKMVRKHEVTRVLNQARRMYFDYLKTQNAIVSTSGSEPAKS